MDALFLDIGCEGRFSVPLLEIHFSRGYTMNALAVVRNVQEGDSMVQLPMNAYIAGVS